MLTVPWWLAGAVCLACAAGGMLLAALCSAAGTADADARFILAQRILVQERRRWEATLEQLGEYIRDLQSRLDEYERRDEEAQWQRMKTH